MQHRHGLASAVALAAGILVWSPPASACMGGFGAGLLYSLTSSLLIMLLMSIVSLASMRAAARAVRRMRGLRDSKGLRVGQAAIVLGMGISIASTVVAGGLLLALVLLV